MNAYMTYETKRLFLRPTTKEDASFIFELFNTPKWLKFIGDCKINSVKDAESYIKEKMRPQLHRLGFSNNTVIRKIDGAKIGTCGLYDREGIDGLDIGFAFLPQYEKKGYAFEASSRILKMAMEELNANKLAGITLQKNLESQKLLQKLGFQFCEFINVPGKDSEILLFRLPQN